LAGYEGRPQVGESPVIYRPIFRPIEGLLEFDGCGSDGR
jgi:hypothetical protein